MAVTHEIVVGDCREVMRGMADASVDAIVCDPPYELGFMNKKWDSSGIAYDGAVWREALRVLKPGGHLVAFGGTRTYHRMACAIEDAGFEVRDSLHWMYGTGFPKSLDVSKAIDAAAGAERTEGARAWTGGGRSGGISHGGEQAGTATRTIFDRPATEPARRWSGWGTALKPAHEPIVLARKPLAGTVAANVLAHGTGALNVDGGRVGFRAANESGWSKTGSAASENRSMSGANYARDPRNEAGSGRWPPNVLLSHSTACGDECADGCAVSTLDEQGGGARFFPALNWDATYDAPFAYVPKASRSEREAGCGELPERGPVRNYHPTVKPIAIMRWLVRLVTPPGGLVLDPFAGSGTTGAAAALEGASFLGIELDADHAAIARARIAHWAAKARAA